MPVRRTPTRPEIFSPMNRSLKPTTAVLLAAALFASVSAFAHDEAKTEKTVATAEAKAAYPLTVCVVSGDKLGGDMGLPVDYLYKEKGKPDRLVRFCCKDCIADFAKEPAKYLKKLDEANAAKAKTDSKP